MGELDALMLWMTLPEHMRFCLTAPVATIICVGPEHEVHANERFAALFGPSFAPARAAREVFGEQWLVLEPVLMAAPVTARAAFVFDGIKKHVTVVAMRGEDAVVCMFIYGDEHPLVATGATERRYPAVSDRRRGRVLLVEDNDDSARSLKLALELRGYEVLVAHDGPVALSVARSHRPDAMLIDIGLPVMDGYELARRVRRETRDDLPIVAVTAYGSESARHRSAEAGFVEHLVKPIDLAVLEQVLDRVVDNSERKEPE